MIVPVICSEGALPEWIILELQGAVLPLGHSRHSSVEPEPELYNGLPLGHLSTKAGEDSKLMLHIGNHKVAGEVKALAKPLLLIQKQIPTAATIDADGDDHMERYVEPSVSYGVRAVVRKKFVCDERPQPIVTAALKV